LNPVWSVILRTTLIGAAQGLLLVVFLLDATRSPPDGFVFVSCGLSFLLLVCGLAASLFRLGRPAHAWRAASQWRTSWLSREVIVLPAGMAMVCLYGLSVFFGVDKPASLWIGALAALLCLALFVCTAMIYASLECQREWHSPLTLLNFFLLGTACGATLAVPVAVLAWPQFTGPLALAAFALSGLAWLACIAALVRNARLRPKSTAASAIGAAHPRIVHAARWAFLVLVFPAPAWLLGWGGGSLAAFAAAFALQFAGLLAERWYFFAEAEENAARRPAGV
jgi:DMSO reductase anchor subunit